MPSPAEHDDCQPPQAVGTNKRKGDELQAETVVRRRASRACLSCRSRKVRCDVTSEGTPCTNCRLDNVACRLTPSSRGRVRASTGSTTVPRAASSDTGERSQRSSVGVTDFPVALTFEGRNHNVRLLSLLTP
jgi:hypothetical protein